MMKGDGDTYGLGDTATCVTVDTMLMICNVDEVCVAVEKLLCLGVELWRSGEIKQPSLV